MSLRAAAALPLLAMLLAAGDQPETAALPEGCRGAVTLFCADPAWPAPDAQAPPARRLTAKVPPVDGPGLTPTR